MRLLAHLLMKLFVLIVQSSVSYLFEMTINIAILAGVVNFYPTPTLPELAVRE